MYHSLNAKRGGSAIVIVIGTIGVLVTLGAVALQVLQHRYRQVHQVASWQEALLAAEAGVDIAINEMRKTVFDPANAFRTQDGWSREAADPAAEPETGSLDPAAGALVYTIPLMLRQSEGGNSSYCRIQVDAPAFLRDSREEQWFRVRCRGFAQVPGGPVAAADKEDNVLRRFDFHRDHITQTAVTTPQVTRSIEIIAKPVGTFRMALFGVNSINMNNHNIVLDSYDSRDPEKSTNGGYPFGDDDKRQWNGNIAVNGTMIQVGSAQVYGTVSTNGGVALNTDNVTGNRETPEEKIRNNFYQEVFNVQRPNVAPDPGTPANVTGSTELIAEADTPSQYLLGTINLSGSSTLRVRGAADGSPTYAQIVVTSDISISGQGAIILDPGVSLRIFLEGNADISGNGVANPNSPGNFQLYGIDRPKNADGSPQFLGNIKIAGNGGLSGTVYAPNYNIEINGGGNSDNIFGSFVGWDISMTGHQAVHYDEALADGGLISDYKVVSWFEDTR
ncbi:MAG: hypothetical protein M3463_14310 [Verrucomicrobiota bacterium]|nr:hypothetical protein [Verrucomicrobiota bacterium]